MNNVVPMDVITYEAPPGLQDVGLVRSRVHIQDCSLALLVLKPDYVSATAKHIAWHTISKTRRRTLIFSTAEIEDVIGACRSRGGYLLSPQNGKMILQTSDAQSWTRQFCRK
jgi:hypothetical protein